jgi:exodeoxyribonuclease V alpha subunit
LASRPLKRSSTPTDTQATDFVARRVLDELQLALVSSTADLHFDIFAANSQEPQATPSATDDGTALGPQHHLLRAHGEPADLELLLDHDQSGPTQDTQQDQNDDETFLHRERSYQPRYNSGVQAETSIEGVVERIVYSNQENGWCVVRLLIRGRGQVTVVGHILGVREGESLRLTGRHTHDRKYGEQFKANSYLTIEPATFIGLERYLGSGLVKGIGPLMARRMVQHFGLNALEIIDHNPERLTEVEGIGPVRSRLIRDAWSEHRQIRNVMVFLQSHGVSTGHAVKIYKRYGDEAVARVKENPYRLAREVYGIGFKSADKIARDLGIPADSPHRAAAGILYCLSQAADKGHVHVPRRDLLDQTAELLELPQEPLGPAIAALLSADDIAVTPVPAPGMPSPPTGDDGEAIFLKALEVAERGVASHIKRLTAQQTLPLGLDTERAVGWFERRSDIKLAANQREALGRSLTAKLLVLTGGPGTGKTTLVRAIVTVLQRKGLRIELAAPTGRAAQRLGEATGSEARTVHRLLEYSPQKGGFTRDPENPLEADLVIIDEASMLDTVLAYHILKALPDAARLIFVGDVDQLPSVGPGRVLADLIESETVDVVRLTEIFRQARESYIITNAHRVQQGEMPHLLPHEKSDFYFIERDEPETILATVKLLIDERIPRGFGFKQREIQILTPMQKGLIGAMNLNAEIQTLINPDGDTVTRGSRLLRVGDRVMQVRNNYDLEVWNGDVGYIESIDAAEQTVRVELDGRHVEYGFSDLDELVLAYACSIHKSQGSEYTAVVIPIHTQHYVMLQRNLLYTALTRGRRLVVVVGSKRALGMAVQRQESTRRATLLVERLQGLI